MQKLNVLLSVLLLSSILFISCSKEESEVDLVLNESFDDRSTLEILSSIKKDSTELETRTFRGHKLKLVKKVTTKSVACNGKKFYYEVRKVVMCGSSFATPSEKFCTCYYDCN